MVPPQANAFLAGFLADSYTAYMFGQLVDIAIWPSAMNWTAAGGSIVLDVNSTVEGTSGASYLSTPQSLPSDADMASSGIRIAMADDVLNQVLAGVWASKAWEDALLPADGDALSAAFAGDVQSATVSMMLPPVASFDTTTGTARLMLGDVEVEVFDPNATSLAKFVLSAQIDLAVQTREDGTVKLVTQTPHIAAQILSQSDQLVVPLDEQKVAAIAELAIKQLTVKADEFLDNMPVPGLSGASIMSPTFQPASGYLLMGGQVLFDGEVQSLAM
jgi:hypothetical protein